MYSLFFLIVLVFIQITSGHKGCIHEKLMKDTYHLHSRMDPPEDEENEFLDPLNRNLDEFVEDLLQDENLHKRKLSTTYTPINIQLDTSYLTMTPADPQMCTTLNVGKTVKMMDGTSWTCQTANILTPALQSFMTGTLLPNIVSWYAQTLSVQSMGTPVTWASGGWSCSSTQLYGCCSNQLPTKFTTTGYNADLVLIVTARPASGSTIAWALPCAYDPYGRPIIGQINFDPAKLNTGAGQLSSQLSTVQHEMTHALGFTSSLYGTYRMPGNGAVRGQSAVVTITAATDPNNNLGKSVTQIITPNVAAQAKAQFACSNWANPGMELEDFGGAGTAGSHWEKRVMNNEYMTGTSNTVSVVSAITLGLFDDMGWYQVNYQQAQYLAWGYNQGCVFANKKCSQWSSLPRFYCNQIYSTTTSGSSGVGCTHDYRAKAYCDLVESTVSIPSYEQYFSDPAQGGSDFYADCCPIYKDFSNGDCRNLDGQTTSAWYYGENTGPTSKCFTGTWTQVSSLSAVHGSCHATQCTNGVLQMQIDSTWITCPTAGGPVNVGQFASSYSGILNCPVYTDVCTGGSVSCPNDCSGQGTCLSSGTCQCNAGRTGNDCASYTCPSANSIQCAGQGVCNAATGVCACGNSTVNGVTIKWTGTTCTDKLCPAGVTGGQCSGNGACDSKTGDCVCNPTYYGATCQYRYCPYQNGTQCGGTNFGTCDPNTGSCTCAYTPNQCYMAVTTASTLTTVAAPVNATTTPATTTAVTTTAAGVTTRQDCSNSYDGYYFGPSCSSYVNNGVSRFIPLDGNASDSQFVVGVNQGLDYVYYSAVIVSVGAGISVTVQDISGGGNIDIYATTGVPGQLNPPLPSASNSIWQSSNPGNISEHIIISNGGADSGVSNFGSSGILLIAALARTNVTTLYNITIQKDPCTDPIFSLCSGHGACLVGVCKCVNLWSGLECEAPACVGTPPCSGTGKCSITVPTALGIPTCVCGPGWAGPACNQFGSGIKDIEVWQTNVGGIGSGTLDIGEFLYYKLTITNPIAVLSVNLVNMNSEKADTILFARANDLPMPGNFDVFDYVSWNGHSSDASLYIDIPQGMRAADWYIGVYNSLYGQASLSFNISANVSYVCPSSMQNCQGEGNCTVANSIQTPSCKCNSNDQFSFMGLLCQYPVKILSNNVPFIPQDINIGNWSYSSYQASNNASSLTISLTRLKPTTGETPYMLIRQGQLPDLLDTAVIDFPSITSSSLTQTVTLSGSNLLPGATYYLGIYNKFYGSSAVQVQITASESNTVSSVSDSCQAIKKSCANGLSPICNCNGNCISSGSSSNNSSQIVSCQCLRAWSGKSCGNPQTYSFSNLIQAAQNIQSICNLCSTHFFMNRGDLKIFRVPQPLGGAGITITVTGLSNTTDPDIFIANQLPRSYYDFPIIQANEGNNETYFMANVTTTGKLWVAIYANFEGTYQLNVTRGDYTVPNSDTSFLTAILTFLTTTLPGKVCLAIAGVVALVLFIVFSLRCCCKKKNEEDINKALENVRHEATETVRDLLGLPGSDLARRASQAGSHHHTPSALVEMSNQRISVVGETRHTSNPTHKKTISNSFPTETIVIYPFISTF